jgi:hypothetical protein
MPDSCAAKAVFVQEPIALAPIPEKNILPDFAHFVDEYDKVMAENFAERLVDHRNIGLATQAVSELAFHHRKRGFDIGAFVIVREKFRTFELEVMVHLLPCSAAVSAMMGRKRDEWNGSNAGNRIGIAATRISLVSGNLCNLKIPCSVLDQSRKHDGVVCVPSKDFNRSHDIGFHSANQVTLNPIVLLSNLPVFVVKPASISASCKAALSHRARWGVCDGEHWLIVMKKFGGLFWADLAFRRSAGAL